ncbi:MAG: response regulator [Rhodospirillales bacterium]|nr:response regulator [Rhodospirillales bacterium]
MSVISPARGDDPFENLRQSFREDSDERLTGMDKLVDQIVEGEIEIDAALPQLRRDAHTLKGMGDASGFPLVSMIAHRLENYLDDLDASRGDRALADIRTHIDAMDDAIAKKLPPDDAAVATALRALPMPRSFNPDDIELRNVEALLVISSRAMGRGVARDLAACGIRTVLTQSPTEAFTLAIRMKPNLVIASATMAELSGIDLVRALSAMAATARIPVAILTSFSGDELAKKGLPTGIPTIRTGDRLSDDLAEVITKYGIG